jgi:hypothetical protein
MSSKIEYTCKGKGGRYEILGLATGAGLTRGEDRLIYKDVSTERLFLRTEADFSERMERLQSEAAPVVERQPNPEPEAFMYQHEETGVIGFVDMQQVEWGFEKNNPRLHIICPLFRAPPELAELQSTIARLTEENERLKSESFESLYNTAIDERDALAERLKGGQGEPVALTVWEGAMPESNGKSNFTVILHTGDLTEGICVYQSEYPGRARYEADCFRNLIGDPAFPEKPFICDYDADKHSGYVKPDTSQPAPVSVPEGWKLVPEVATLEMKNSGWQECERQGIDPEAIEMQTVWTAMHLSAPACLDKVKELNQ